MKKKNSSGENIRVVIRCRNLLPYESERGDKALVRLDLATNQVVVQHSIGDPDVFAFDAVYNNTFTQRDIFLQEVQPLADAVLQGYNATVFAYGQSGSGKTHTMTGKLSEKETWGMMPQVMDYLFSEIKKQTSTTKTFKVKVSYVELYNGKSRDLLTAKQVNLEIKQNMAKNFYVKGAEMPEVTSFNEAIRWFNVGTERRQTASTDLNDTSSRSHSLFTIQIEQFDFENDPSSPIVMTSKINVVDLAGSEKLSKTNAIGETAKEGCNINLSLSALATVIDTIVKGAKHVPYRGSPLTMLLKDSLGGNAKTVMFANVGPSDKNTSETISTLRFALRAKQIENKPLKNMDPKDARIQELIDQIEELKTRLGNVDLNVEDELRQRIEELEIENFDLRGSDEKVNLEIEERCRALQAQAEEKEKDIAERTKELRREVEARELTQANLANEVSRANDLRTMCIHFIHRVCTEDQLKKLTKRMPKDGSYNKDEEKWNVKEISFHLQGFAEMYEHWRSGAFTKEDMESYASKALSELQDRTQRQMVEESRTREELTKKLSEESQRRAADNQSISQLKVDVNALRDENMKLREKITRDQEKIKAKLASQKEEYKALQDQLEATKVHVTERERDVERFKRMLEDNDTVGSLNRSTVMNPSTNNWASNDERAAVMRQLEEERHAREVLQSRIKETNVSLRRFGVCISDPSAVEGSDAASAAANQETSFVLAAADEKPIDDDLFAQLQQQIRTKQRLAELSHLQQMRLDDMVRKYELLRTGQVTSNAPGSPLLQGGAAGVTTDEAMAMQIKEILQRKEDEIEQLHREKDQTCDKLVKKLNKCERKIKDLEAVLEEERSQLQEERSELSKENNALQQFNQQLSLELENTRVHLAAAKEQLDSLQIERDKGEEYYKAQMEELHAQIDQSRNTSAEFEEMRHSYERLQQQVARTEHVLNERTEQLENSRSAIEWSNAQLQQEKSNNAELERIIQNQEVEMQRMEDNWRMEAAAQINNQVSANNRRLEAQADQFQEMLAEEQAKYRSLQKKVKSAKSSASKVAQRYDEMILENEAILSKMEELKVTSMKMYLEKQEAQRDLESLRPTSNVRARGL